jgi:hypothetical protein
VVPLHIYSIDPEPENYPETFTGYFNKVFQNPPWWVSLVRAKLKKRGNYPEYSIVKV